jgi:hypothetical protein
VDTDPCPAPLLLAPRRRRCASPHVACALVAILWSFAAKADAPASPGAPAQKPRQALAVPEAPASQSEPDHAANSIAPLVDDGSMHRAVAVVTGSVGFAGIVVGGVFGILTISQWDQVKESLPSCRDMVNYKGCPAAVKEGQLVASSYATVSTYSIVTGTAAIVGGIVLWYVSPRLPQSPARISFVPVVSPGGAAGFVTGVF